MNKKLVVIGLSLIFIVFLLVGLASSPWSFAGGNEQKGYEIKEKLGTYTLVEKLSGADALEQINHLHGQDIKIDDAYILHYESENGMAIVWISKSPSEEEAKSLFQKMNDRMGGSSMYTNHTEIKIDEMTLQYVFGMDMDNYYYFKNNRVIWISIIGDEKNQFIEEAIDAF